MKNLDHNQETEAPYILEKEQRLSRSMLYTLQRKFFEKKGVGAWSEGIVPHYITTNPFIANTYAALVFAYLRDCASVQEKKENTFPPLDPDQPVYIIELGTGSGRFSYYFLRKFLRLYERSDLREIPFTYVMTDFAQQNIEAWQSHPQLQEFIEKGMLDFACFDTEHDRELELITSGATLKAGTVKNPVIVMANYFFDSIPQDVFLVHDGELYESLVTLAVDPEENEEPDTGDPELIDRVNITHDHCPLENDDYYDDGDINRILKNYREEMGNTSILFPITALHCCRLFRELSGDRMLLLSSDKGYIHEDLLLHKETPGITTHGGFCFSMDVNYHAIAQYFKNSGGDVLHSSHRSTSLIVGAFLMGANRENFIHTNHAFADTVELFGPDDFFSLKKGIEKNYNDLDPAQIMSLIRLSGYDSRILKQCHTVLLDSLEKMTNEEEIELFRLINQVWDLYYHIGEEENLPFQLAMLLFGIGYFPESLEFHNHSLRLYGPNDETYFYGSLLCSTAPNGKSTPIH